MAANVDAGAVLRYLARSTPGVIGALGDNGVDSYPKLMAVALWLLTAAVSGQPDLQGDIDELGNVLVTAYEAAVTVFRNANPGIVEAVADAGSILVLTPPVVPSGRNGEVAVN